MYNTLFCPNKNELQLCLKPFKLRRGSCAFETGQTKPRCSQHVNVVTVREIVVCSNMDQIFIVMDFVQYDLKGLMDTMRKKNQVFLSGEVKTAKHDLVYSFRRLSNVHSGQAKDVVFYPVYYSRACKTRTSKWTSRTSADQTSNVTSQNWAIAT